MAVVTIDLKHHRYDVRIETGALTQLGPMVRQTAPHSLAAFLADAAVIIPHGDRAIQSLESAGFRVASHPFAAGEAQKNFRTVLALYDVLLDSKLERRSPVIAFGGGVVGDVVGFVAATYLRGVPLVQCPTTLLAMVDASIGGKVGVNVPHGKNLIGAFYQPALVVIDPDVLRTLPRREFCAGLAECIKHGVLGDTQLFDWTATNIGEIMSLDPETLTRLIERNVALKAGIVVEDEKESGRRALLNLGHTFAHAIEATSGYGTLLHGEAVSIGMVAATQLAVATKRCKPQLLTQIKELLSAAELPVSGALASDEELMAAMGHDKKVVDGDIRFILPTKIGSAEIVSGVSPEAILDAWASVRS